MNIDEVFVQALLNLQDRNRAEYDRVRSLVVSGELGGLRLRPFVRWFAGFMEKRLAQFEGKNSLPIDRDYLLARLLENLATVVQNAQCNLSGPYITRQMADVANYLGMLVAHVCNGPERGEHDPVEEMPEDDEARASWIDTERLRWKRLAKGSPHSGRSSQG